MLWIINLKSNRLIELIDLLLLLLYLLKYLLYYEQSICQDVAYCDVCHSFFLFKQFYITGHILLYASMFRSIVLCFVHFKLMTEILPPKTGTSTIIHVIQLPCLRHCSHCHQKLELKNLVPTFMKHISEIDIYFC